jgi:hypothetical protein
LKMIIIRGVSNIFTTTMHLDNGLQEPILENFFGHNLHF